MKKATTLLISAIFLLVFAGAACAANYGPLGTINQYARSLNYEDSSKSMTVDIYYNCTGSRQFNVSFPSGFTLTSTGGICSLHNSSLSICSFSNINPYGRVTFTGSNSAPDYTLSPLTTSLSNTTSCSLNGNISILKIPDEDVFQTLIEFGRGRGNYFYSTYSGKAGSGHTGTGCPYVPNNTLFELNFLHKVFNIRQYFDDPNMMAKNATFECSYPTRTIVRTHLGTSIAKGATLSSETNVSYKIEEIEGSWERMGYLGMDFDASEQSVGQNLAISCKNIQYAVPNAYGNITVPSSALTLQVRNPKPFIAVASSAATIGNGSQEVLITYNITNTESYTADSVIIEIEAPQYATFIGTRAELWGAALDQYRIEKAELKTNESEVITLVARFNTSTAPNMTSLNLTQKIKIKYTTCWEINAYNPTQYMQYLQGIGATSVNMGVPTTIINIIQQINEIYNLLTVINSTTININNTVTRIENIVNIINSTTIDTNNIVKQINNTVNQINNKTTLILNNTNTIISDTSTIKDLLNCNGSVDTPMCTQLDSLNSSVTNITNLIININATLANLSIDIDVNLSDQNISINVTPDLTNITIIIEDIMAELNCTNITGEPQGAICRRVIRIENNTISINNTVNSINNLINYFNSTVFGNITIQDIIDALNNVTVDTSSLLSEIRRVREFDEELVFLVTDAFGLAQEARAAAGGGDLGEATAKLREANSRLAQATQRLMEAQKEGAGLVTEKKSLMDSMFPWIVALLAILIIGFYLFAKVPPESSENY
jgi:hypothetical protein